MSAVVACAPEEREREETKAVERGQACRHRSDAPQGPTRRAARLDGLPEDLVLAEKAGGEGETGKTQGADQKSEAGHGHLLGQPAHLEAVLLVAHAVDDRTCAQEEKGFEERMRGNVEDRG